MWLCVQCRIILVCPSQNKYNEYIAQRISPAQYVCTNRKMACLVHYTIDAEKYEYFKKWITMNIVGFNFRIDFFLYCF